MARASVESQHDPGAMSRLLAHHWSRSVLDNPEVEPARLMHVLGYLLSAVSQADDAEEATAHLSVANKLVSRLPESHAADAANVMAQIESRRKLIELRRSSSLLANKM
jgi:hypothetical protein